jgi:predicted unusual protein kinase regulating ubiquinone biosynthesis (AarF/ABC1/UbiB family)
MSPDEKNSLKKRVGRYAEVTSTVLRVGAETSARSLLQKPLDNAGKAEILRRAMGGLKGPIMKIAQILGTIPDLVPKEYADAFAELQANAPPMGPAFVKRRMAAELGPAWQSQFRSFDLQAAAAASLGQVHRAEGLDGRALACKLQYPDMASVVEADIRQMKIAFAVYEHYDRAVATKDVQAEIANRLREELDYKHEAQAMVLFRAMLAEFGGVHIPEIVASLSTDRLLTMDWLSGARLADVANEAEEDVRNEVACNLFYAWYLPFYRYAILHGDPHLGNYTVCPDNSLNLFDFGCIRVFEPRLVQGVLSLYKSLIEDKPDLAVEAYRSWGFAEPSQDLIAILNIWARFIYAPLLEDRERLIEETNTGLYGRETANKIHLELRKIGGITIPRAFVFMDRAAVGLGSVFLRLRARLNWRALFEDVVGAFDLAEVTQAQAEILKKARL